MMLSSTKSKTTNARNVVPTSLKNPMSGRLARSLVMNFEPAHPGIATSHKYAVPTQMIGSGTSCEFGLLQPGMCEVQLPKLTATVLYMNCVLVQLIHGSWISSIQQLRKNRASNEKRPV